MLQQQKSPARSPETALSPVAASRDPVPGDGTDAKPEVRELTQ